MWNELLVASRRIVFEAQRSPATSARARGGGGGGSERWNYASVHLTECDESDRNSRQRPSRARVCFTGACNPLSQPWNWKWDSFALKMILNAAAL